MAPEAAVRVPGYQPPTWPSGAIPKQVHLDLAVGDLGAAEAEAIRLGPTGPVNSRGPEDGVSCWIRSATRSACATGARRYRLTTRCAIRVGTCWPGGLSCWWLPLGGTVGDQAGDRQEGLVEFFAASEVALEGAPLLVLGVGVLDADPL